MSQQAKTRKSVLVVEDEPGAREASERYLELVGYDVETAANAPEAFKKADLRDPDLLVCDWQLGKGPDGAEVARQLQERYEVSVIFVTAHPLDELRAATGDIDVTHYISKPLQLPLLAQVIRESIGS